MYSCIQYVVRIAWQQQILQTQFWNVIDLSRWVELIYSIRQHFSRKIRCPFKCHSRMGARQDYYYENIRNLDRKRPCVQENPALNAQGFHKPIVQDLLFNNSLYQLDIQDHFFFSLNNPHFLLDFEDKLLT